MLGGGAGYFSSGGDWRTAAAGQVLDFLWDGQDRLRTVKEGANTVFTAEYNGDGLRTRKTDWRGGVFHDHKFAWSPFGLLWDSHPNHVYTPGWGHRSNGINSFYHSDWIWSTRYISDITGNNFPSALRFDAYGNRSVTQVRTNTPVRSTAEAGGMPKPARLTALPAGVATLVLQPDRVVGGEDVRGTVTLRYSAPEGGAVIALSSDKPAVAGVPVSVTILPGQRTATFPVGTLPTSTTTTVAITASYGGLTTIARLTVLKR